MTQTVKIHWRRFDTLFLRLFVLMWVVLVGSHLIAFTTVTSGAAGGPGRPHELPVLPSLPPGNPFDTGSAGLGPGGPGGPGGPPPGMRDGMRPSPGDRAPDGPRDPPSPRDGNDSDDRGANRGGLSPRALWLDYALRMLVIALGAALGARWLAAPMRRLADAAGHLADGFGRGRPAPQLDERHGTHEVRAAAQVFNRMAQRLQEQFDARGLQMAALSHDLRTPLTRLRLRLEGLPAELASVSDPASADVREIDELIDATLAVLREQRDGTEAVAVDLVALVQAIADDLADQGHDVTVQADGAARVRGHPAALRRIVGNLVGNALRYGTRARLAVTATAQQVALTVDDDGPGIPPQQIELAFQPWVRLASGGTRAGHGLGLAIARDLAERDGATVTLENRAEGGLRARLVLPPMR